MPIHVTSTRTDQIRVAAGDDWAELAFEETSGVAILNSSFGHWTHHWLPEHRDVPLAVFLSELDRWYAGKKFLKDRHFAYDRQATAQGLRDFILAERRIGSITREQAREEWNKISLLEDKAAHNWLLDTRLKNAWELIRRVENPAWVAFWERLWVPGIQPALQKIRIEKPVRDFDPGVARDHKEARDFWADLGQEMRTQNRMDQTGGPSHATAHPLYMATEEVRVYGIDTSLTDPDGYDLAKNENEPIPYTSHRCLIEGAVALTRRGIETWLATHGKKYRDPQIYQASAHEVLEMRHLIDTLTGRAGARGEAWSKNSC